MTQIKQLRDLTAFNWKIETPQCEHTRINRYYSDPKGQPLPQCELQSSFQINGKHYCKRHAGDVALKLLMEQPAQTELVAVLNGVRTWVDDCGAQHGVAAVLADIDSVISKLSKLSDER